MKKIRLLHRVLTLLTLTFVMTLGLLIILPLEELYASPSVNQSNGSTEEVDGTAGASEAGELKFEHYVPLPIEPIQREANNILLGSGLIVAVLAMGVAFVMDKRGKERRLV